MAVVGRVGSGKTSFVSALIGEMTKNTGTPFYPSLIGRSLYHSWIYLVRLSAGLVD